MTKAIEIQPARGPVCGEIKPPGSKSITNRALICAALAQGNSILHGALESEDTQVMIEGLRRLGIAVETAVGGETIRVAGCQGVVPANHAELFVGNSGTTIRFLTALATLGRGEYRLAGIERMHQRPIGDLADALSELGGKIACESPGRCPPVRVMADGLPGGKATVRGDISSQYLSGLMMAAPYAENPVTLTVSGTLVSIPYVAMTQRVMEAFGVVLETCADYSVIRVPNASGYRGCDYEIEPDASAASYFWAAAAVTGGKVKVRGLGKDSLQGDVGFLDCLIRMGCEVQYADDGTTLVGKPLVGIDVDMNGISDTVQTLAVVALFAKGITRIRNVGHIRHKETDRISAVATELRKLGASVVESPEGLEITPGSFTAAEIDTYNDHRMAMSFAVAGLAKSGIVIRNPGCTAKTYPSFFEALGTLVR